MRPALDGVGRSVARDGLVVSTPYGEPSIRHILQAAHGRGILDDAYVPLELGLLADFAPSSRQVGCAGRFASRRSFSVPVSSTIPLSELAVTGAWLMPRLRPQLLGWRGERLDRIVARRLRRSEPAAFVGMPYSSLLSFRAARARGTTTFLNHVNANLRSENLVFALEAMARSPTERADFRRERWPDRIVRRVDREVEEVDYVLAPSPYVREDLVARGVPSDKVVLVPYGVDTQCFSPVERDAEDRALRLLYVGQVGTRKGLLYLTQAMREATLPPERLRLIGPVVNRKRLPDASHAAIEHRPTIDGAALLREYQSADVFVLPSLAEGMALVVLEAMACGLPVIITRETGYEGIVRDGREGFVVPTRDPRAIARALDALSSDGALRCAMGDAGRRRAEEYSWKRFEDASLCAIRERLPKASLVPGRTATP